MKFAVCKVQCTVMFALCIVRCEMYNKQCIVQCAVCRVTRYNAVCSVQCAVYSVQCAVCIVQCTVQFALCSVRCECTMYKVQCSVQCAVYSVKCAMFSLRGVKYAICSGQCIHYTGPKKVNLVWSIIDVCHNRLNRERLYRRTTFYQKNICKYTEMKQNLAENINIQQML